VTFSSFLLFHSPFKRLITKFSPETPERRRAFLHRHRNSHPFLKIFIHTQKCALRMRNMPRTEETNYGDYKWPSLHFTQKKTSLPQSHLSYKLLKISRWISNIIILILSGLNMRNAFKPGFLCIPDVWCTDDWYLVFAKLYTHHLPHMTTSFARNNYSTVM